MPFRKDEIYQYLKESTEAKTADQVSEDLQLHRTNVSRYLNELYKEGKIVKIKGRPVLYKVTQHPVAIQADEENTNSIPLLLDENHLSFDHLIGAEESLSSAIQKGKAAILYPPAGLHTMIFGPSGTGKTLFAECMYQFAKESEVVDEEAPFIAFNCADYAQNPQLLFGHIFGIKKGAFTGADEDRPGLIQQANGGILFLDEIHRLPPEGQEMLFTFIDKGVYHPLGESGEEKKATVQIIGATTESEENFLETFKRRIPMCIELPSLADRTIEERYQMITSFFLQEAMRLGTNILLHRDVLLAFLLYSTPGNIGQLKRDIKLVCAKGFLHYQQKKQTEITIEQQDLPITVQKGLLNEKHLHQEIQTLLHKKWHQLYFNQEERSIHWQTKEVTENEKNEAFSLYTLEKEVQEEVPLKTQKLADRVCDEASMKLNRVYSKKDRFTLALHLQAAIERIQSGKKIPNQKLNEIRKHYLLEFQVALELASMIEQEYHLFLPMEEIGYLSLLLHLPVQEKKKAIRNHVSIITIMHGEEISSAMLKSAQELTGIREGYAMNMPMTMDVSEIYEELKSHVLENKEEYQNGILLLTDMGSLNRLAGILEEDIQIKTESISLTSTLVVMEALQLAHDGYSLSEIKSQLTTSIRDILYSNEKEAIEENYEKPKAIIVSCFTGESVANKLESRLEKLIPKDEYQIIPMQFLESGAFIRHIDHLRSEYDVRAIIGTAEIHYQNIPYFSALDLFDEERAQKFYGLLENEIDLWQIERTLSETLTHIPDLDQCLSLIHQEIKRMKQTLHIILDPSVELGIIMHLAFLIDLLLTNPDASQRTFPELETFKKENKLPFDIISAQLLSLEKKYGITISDDEIAYIAQIFVNN